MTELAVGIELLDQRFSPLVTLVNWGAQLVRQHRQHLFPCFSVFTPSRDVFHNPDHAGMSALVGDSLYRFGNPDHFAIRFPKLVFANHGLAYRRLVKLVEILVSIFRLKEAIPAGFNLS